MGNNNLCKYQFCQSTQKICVCVCLANSANWNHMVYLSADYFDLRSFQTAFCRRFYSWFVVSFSFFFVPTKLSTSMVNLRDGNKSELTVFCLHSDIQSMKRVCSSRCGWFRSDLELKFHVPPSSLSYSLHNHSSQLNSSSARKQFETSAVWTADAISPKSIVCKSSDSQPNHTPKKKPFISLEFFFLFHLVWMWSPSPHTIIIRRRMEKNWLFMN